MILKPDTFPPQMPTDLECKKVTIPSADFLRVLPKSPKSLIHIYLTTCACVLSRMMNILPSKY